MMCTHSGCGDPAASRFSNYCNLHKARLRRHGAPDQRGITKTDLRPYAELVRDWIARNPDNPAWGQLEARWKQLGEAAAEMVAAFQNGRPSVSWQVSAAHEIVRLSRLVEPSDVLITTAAMKVMEELDPRRFRSDTAFRAQLSRRVRALADASAPRITDWRTGKTRLLYREFSPRAAQVLAQWVAEALGIAGLHIARKELEGRRTRAESKEQLHAGLETLS